MTDAQRVDRWIGKLMNATKSEDAYIAKDVINNAFEDKEDRIAELEEKLKHTVTTKYHDDLVNDWNVLTVNLKTALHHISRCSQNSMCDKGECGRIARKALEENYA